MIKRPEIRRQNLSSTHVHSAYFTSTGTTTEQTPSVYQQSMPAYGYSQPASSYYGQETGMSAGYDDSAVQKLKSPPTKSSSGRVVTILLFIIWTAAIVGATLGFIYNKILPEQVKQVEDRLNVELQAEQLYRQRYDELQLHVREMEQQHEEETALLQQSNAELARERQAALELKEKVSEDDRRADALIDRIKESSRLQLIKKYGAGPYRVELAISFRGLADKSDMSWMTFELAGAHEMPHTVFNFLEQVTTGLYDSGEFSFQFNGPHISMAAPSTSGLEKIFSDSGLASVLVQEYSPNFNHQKYTLGRGGRPSGPRFYINMKDNSALHGPNGYAQDGSADPCFGRITRNPDVMDRIHAAAGPLERGDWKKVESSIAIVSIEIVQ